MNDYAAKRQARIDRLQARAASLDAAADRSQEASTRHLDAIPFGQPILVGHHSEARHRRDIARSDAAMRKSIELRSEAKDARRRAEAAEDNTAISSDDPDALDRLRAKLAHLKAIHERMVLVNRLLRGKKTDEEIAAATSLPASSVAALRKPDALGRTGFADYRIKNSSAQIRATEQRLAELESRRAATPHPSVDVGVARIEQTANRVRIVFPAKPAPAMIHALKAGGFHWSPTVGAWQRMLSPQAWSEARRILGVTGIAGEEPAQ